jgi:hypothetical protein
MGLETIKPINEEENLKRVTGGFRGGPFFQKMNLPPPMYIENGWPDGVREKLDIEKTPTETPIDSWNQRR